MGKSLNQLLNEANSIIEKKASVNTQSHMELELTADDEVVKLASFLMEEDKELAEQVAPRKTHEKVASIQVSEDEVNMGVLEPQSVYIEKIAESLAIVDTLINIQELAKLENFEKKARAAGHSDEQIEEYLQKQAKASAAKGMGTGAKAALTMLGLTGAGTAGGLVGRKKGQQEGYGEALGDVEKAFRQYGQTGY